MISQRKLIFNPLQHSSWIRHSALTPTPFLLNEKVIRVYCAFRDDEGVSRIGYVDVDAKDPFKVLGVSNKPVLDIGRDGCFDDNGVILGHIERRDQDVWMYYVGFQLVKKAKFLAFSGLAISLDGGNSFKRYSEAPILDRVNGGTTIRAIHSVIKESDGSWKVWFAQGDDWEMIDGKPFPQYNIYEATSPDGIHFKDARLVVDNDHSKNEYRIGRPSAFQLAGQKLMFFTKGTKIGKDYFPGMAYLNDGQWHRDDSLFPLKLSSEGWDSQHLCYPRLLTAHGKSWLFYNGNNMGYEGFGAAEVTEWVQSGLKDTLNKTN